MRLLLAEDEEEMSNALVKILKSNNYSVDAVNNGNDALDYIESDIYDGAILDIMMLSLLFSIFCSFLHSIIGMPVSP